MLVIGKTIGGMVFIVRDLYTTTTGPVESDFSMMRS